MKKISNRIRKTEIFDFFYNILENKKKFKQIKINQFGPNGFLIRNIDLKNK